MSPPTSLNFLLSHLQIRFLQYSWYLHQMDRFHSNSNLATLLDNFMIHIESESQSHSVVSDSLWPHGLYSPWNPPGQNTGVGCHALLQGIFPTKGSNPGLSHCRRILYQLSQQGNPPLPLWKEDPNYSTKVLSRHLAKAQAVCIRPWGSA